jgi:excisionase family DNA binding protein
MMPAALAFVAGERRILARLEALAERLDAGDDGAWPDFLATISTLAVLDPVERRPLATTKEMAERLNVTPKTVRRLGKAGRLEAVRLGRRGPGAIRWRSA